MAAKKPLEKQTKAELAGRLTKEQLLAAVRQAEMPDGVGYQVTGPVTAVPSQPVSTSEPAAYAPPAAPNPNPQGGTP